MMWGDMCLFRNRAFSSAANAHNNYLSTEGVRTDWEAEKPCSRLTNMRGWKLGKAIHSIHLCQFSVLCHWQAGYMVLGEKGS